MKRVLAIVLGLCLLSGLSVNADIDTIEGSTIAAGGGSCANSQVAPTADTTDGSWVESTGSTEYEVIDDGWQAVETGDYVSCTSGGCATASVWRFSLPGDCDVDAIDVGFYHESTTTSDTVSVQISPDNSTWETAETFATVSAPTAGSVSFTGLSWTTPTYCYVRVWIDTENWQPVLLYNVTVEVTP
jgi:hypothetical protein